MVTKRILPAISRGAVILHRSQLGIQGGKQAVFTEEHGLAPSPEKGAGHPMTWSFQSLEVGASSGTMSGCNRVEMAQNSSVWRATIDEIID